jgi:hypothetical protein
MPPQQNTLERKIYFYRAHLGVDGGGRPLVLNLTPALRHINRLRFNDAGGYLVDGDEALCCWVDSPNPHQRLRLGQIRRSGLPQVEQGGTLTDLVIPPDSGLVEAIHVVAFRNNIVGSDFNFYGPRMSRLSLYLHEKAAGRCPDVTFEPLLRQDMAAELDRLREIRMFHLKIRAPYAATVAQANRDLGAAFEAAARAGNAEELEIVLRPRKHSRDALADRMLRLSRWLARRGDLRTEACKFEVKGVRADTGDVELMDVLRDQLVARKEILRQSRRGRALDSGSAYQAIERAFRELEPELAVAAGVAP